MGYGLWAFSESTSTKNNKVFLLFPLSKMRGSHNSKNKLFFQLIVRQHPCLNLIELGCERILFDFTYNSRVRVRKIVRIQQFHQEIRAGDEPLFLLLER
jgi:hypothetical protein